MYLVWQYNLARSALYLVDRKPISRWNQDYEAAVWVTRSAANKWAGERMDRGTFMVMKCRGRDLCGIEHDLEESDIHEEALGGQ